MSVRTRTRLSTPLALLIALAAALARDRYCRRAAIVGSARMREPHEQRRTQTLLDCVTLEGVRAHQAAFQAIADDERRPVYPGTRAADRGVREQRRLRRRPARGRGLRP